MGIEHLGPLGWAGPENGGKEQVWTDRKSLWDLSEESGDI